MHRSYGLNPTVIVSKNSHSHNTSTSTSSILLLCYSTIQQFVIKSQFYLLNVEVESRNQAGVIQQTAVNC